MSKEKPWLKAIDITKPDADIRIVEAARKLVISRCEDCQGEMCEEHGTHNGHPIGNCFACKDGL